MIIIIETSEMKGCMYMNRSDNTLRKRPLSEATAIYRDVFISNSGKVVYKSRNLNFNMRLNTETKSILFLKDSNKQLLLKLKNVLPFI